MIRVRSKKMNCRYCGENEIYKFMDLGQQPLANDYMNERNINKGQYHLP